jgi:tetratricopeptide (TPR) repeat protein
MNRWLARVIILLIAGAGSVLCLQYAVSHFKSDRQLILLNRTRPDLHLFLDIEKQPSVIPPQGDLKEYFDYFHLVTEAMPDNSDGVLMLGYLDEITGNQAQAQILLKESYRLDPQFFFTEYNLACIYFKQGNYTQSIDFLQEALGAPPAQTVSHMMRSVIYRQIFASVSDNNEIAADLQQAYHDAYILLMELKQKESQGADIGPHVHAHII